jgi:hypothetical protein
MMVKVMATKASMITMVTKAGMVAELTNVSMVTMVTKASMVAELTNVSMITRVNIVTIAKYV